MPPYKLVPTPFASRQYYIHLDTKGFVQLVRLLHPSIKSNVAKGDIEFTDTERGVAQDRIEFVCFL